MRSLNDVKIWNKLNTLVAWEKQLLKIMAGRRKLKKTILGKQHVPKNYMFLSCTLAKAGSHGTKKKILKLQKCVFGEWYYRQSVYGTKWKLLLFRLLTIKFIGHLQWRDKCLTDTHDSEDLQKTTRGRIKKPCLEHC